MPFELWAFGSNGSGQLGLGHEEDTSIPARCVLSNEQRTLSSRPSHFSAGGNHTLLICEDGSLFAAGANDDGRCGLENLNRASTLTKVSIQGSNGQAVDQFKLCAAAWESSTFVTVDDKVYTCGTGSKGELGQGMNVTAVTTPKLVPHFPPVGTSIVQLASTMSHTVAVLSNGEVYGWGSGRKGQLGQPSVDTFKPRKISDLTFRAVAAVCGREFTYIVGGPEHGQHLVLGSDKWNIKSSAPHAVPGWKELGANWGGIHVLLNNGAVRSWGRHNHGQLCPDEAPPLEHIASGSEHVVARSIHGDILAWGWGEHGNCGEPIKEKGEAMKKWNHIDVDRSFDPFGSGCATTFLVRKVAEGVDNKV